MCTVLKLSQRAMIQRNRKNSEFSHRVSKKTCKKRILRQTTFLVVLFFFCSFVIADKQTSGMIIIMKTTDTKRDAMEGKI